MQTFKDFLASTCPYLLLSYLIIAGYTGFFLVGMHVCFEKKENVKKRSMVFLKTAMSKKKY